MTLIQRRLLTTAVALALLFGLGSLARSRLGLELDVESVRAFAQGLGTAGPALFVLVVAGRSLLALPSQIVLIAAGLCFGTLVGTLVGGAGLMLSGLFLFTLARYAGRQAIEARIGPRQRQLLEIATHRSGAVALAIACGYPLLPLTPIQAAAGLTPMPVGFFIPAAFVGGLIRASIFAYFGNSLIDLSLKSFLQTLGLFAVLVAIPFAFPTGRAWLREALSREKPSGDPGEP